jgi:hypothetical protein
MSQSIKLKLQQLEESAREYMPEAQDGAVAAEIALQELIIPAQMAALFHERRLLNEKRTWQHPGGTKERISGTRLKNAEDIRTEALRFGASHQALRQCLQDLRDLTGDSDKAWRERSERLQRECDEMLGLPNGEATASRAR